MAQAPCKGLSGHHAGFREWIDATETKEHIEYLYQRGVSLTTIALNVGLTAAGVAYIRNKSRWVRRGVSEAILDLTPRLALVPEMDETIRRKYVDTEPSRRARGPRVLKEFGIRRLRALQCMGWPLDTLSEKVGFNTWNFMQCGTRGSRTTRTRHEAVVRVYDELWNVPGPSHSARCRAFKAGYHPPLAWDDIDNLACKPRGVAKDAMPKDRQTEEREERRRKRAVERRSR
jgi:hypothetical protein